MNDTTANVLALVLVAIMWAACSLTRQEPTPAIETTHDVCVDICETVSAEGGKG